MVHVSQLLEALDAAGAKTTLRVESTASPNLLVGIAKGTGQANVSTAAPGNLTPALSVKFPANSAVVATVAGSSGLNVPQEATGDLDVQLRSAGVAYDARQIRALTSADVVDVSDRTARELGKVDPYRQDTVYNWNQIGSPGPNTNIVTVTPGTAGHWEIFVWVGVFISVNVGDVANMQLFKNAVLFGTLPNGASKIDPFGPFRFNLTATDTLSVKNVVGTAAGSFYEAAILCNRTG